MKEQLTNDMSVGNPAKKLFFFAVPIVLGNLFQQLYNIIDSMVVGRFVGAQALAAVGASTAIVFLFVAVATGSSIGYSVVISQLFGAKDQDRMMTAIYTALISTFVLGLILMIIGAAGTGGILVLMRTPADIYRDAADYLRIYMFGLVFLFMYNTLNAVYNALGASKIPLYFLAGSSILNIVLDLYFVIRLQMGVTGVAWATLIAQGLAAVISFINLLFRLKRSRQKQSRFYLTESFFSRWDGLQCRLWCSSRSFRLAWCLYKASSTVSDLWCSQDIRRLRRSTRLQSCRW